MEYTLSVPTISAETVRNNKDGKKRVLVVDDEPDITMTISAVLETDGLEVFHIMILY